MWPSSDGTSSLRTLANYFLSNESRLWISFSRFSSKTTSLPDLNPAKIYPLIFWTAVGISYPLFHIFRDPIHCSLVLKETYLRLFSYICEICY